MIGVAYTPGDWLSVFTQCSKCETVFRLSAQALRTAGGQVRCGRCGEVFNALTRLAEDATGFTKGESSLDQETRADEILETIADEAVFDYTPPGVDVARLEFLEPLDEELTAETSLESTLPAGDLDRIFVETRPGGPLHQLTAEGPRGERGIVPIHPESKAAAPPETEPVIPADAVSAAPAAALVPPPSPPSPPSPPETPEPAPPAPMPAPMPIQAALSSVAPLTRIAGLEVSEEVRQAMMSSYSASKLPQLEAARPWPASVWLSAAAVLSLLLVIQIAHSNRDWLSAHASLLGVRATPRAMLSAYQLRQWGVTGDPGAPGTLRVRASIMNTAAQLQPFPLLRVSLVNRFGTRVGAREFEPREYLGRATARMLAPGERTDATLDIIDPGNDAEGFEIDVCVRGPDKTTFCAADTAAQSK
jgi:predicted Zn finger-like uncharacterized protein